MPVTADDVHAADRTLAPYVRRTPLLPLPADAPGEPEPDAWLKPENLQRTGSFKLRGALNAVANLPEAVRRRGVVTHSSGNHGQAVACAAATFGVPATVVIPEGAPRVKLERTRAWGATVLRCENTAADRERVAREAADASGATLVPPYDHPGIIAGQGTVGLEIARSLPGVTTVLVPIGGGGLSAGTALALAHQAPAARVIGVEPEWAADAAESLRRGERTAWPAEAVTRTIADGVRTQIVGKANFELLQRHLAGMVTVSDEAIRRAAAWYPRHARLVAEPTGSLTLAAWWKLREGLVEDLPPIEGPTVVVISGGNVDDDALRALLDDAALR